MNESMKWQVLVARNYKRSINNENGMIRLTRAPNEKLNPSDTTRRNCVIRFGSMTPACDRSRVILQRCVPVTWSPMIFKFL